MSTNDTVIPSRGGRPKTRTDDSAKPVSVSGQIEKSEKAGITSLAERTGRSESYWVRYSVKLLLREVEAGRIDPAIPLTQQFQ